MSECYETNQNLNNLISSKFCSYNILNPIVCCPYCKFIQSRFLFGLNVKITFDVEVSFSGSIDDNYNEPQLVNLEEECLQEVLFPCNKYEIFEDLDDSIRCHENPHLAEDFVIGGYDPKIHGYPHMVLIGHGESSVNVNWMCSGSIISQYYILSAAHCITKFPLEIIKFAATGIKNRTYNSKHWQIYEVVKITVHPGYQPHSMYHDIALLRTGARIMYNNGVIPACLHRGNDLPNLATAMGWGAIDHRDPIVDVLNGVDIWKFPDQDCMKVYPEHRYMIYGYDSSTQACYGDERYLQGSCEANTGGPLQVRTNLKNSKCLHIILGVTTYGRACGNLGSPGLFTRVAYYVPWIESVTGSLS